MSGKRSRGQDEKPTPVLSRGGRWAPWILVAAVVLIFGRVVTHTFTPVDDASTISLNARLNPPRWDGQGVLWYWRHAELGLYIPATYMVWGALATATWVGTPDEYGVRLDPRVFHAASLGLHLLSALAVYPLLRQLMAAVIPSPGTPGEGQGGGSSVQLKDPTPTLPRSTGGGRRGSISGPRSAARCYMRCIQCRSRRWRGRRE
jgi:hypothetical protein